MRVKLLILGCSHRRRVSFGVILDQLYRTHRLHQAFEIYQYVGQDDATEAIVDDVHIHRAGADPKEEESSQLGKVLDEVQPDLVLLVGEIGHFTATLPVLRGWRGPIVGWFPVNFERTRNPYAWTGVLCRCDRVIAQAEFGRCQLLRDCAQVGRVRLGVDTETFRPLADREKRSLRIRLGWDPDGFVFLFVGRNNARKGVAQAIDAFRLYSDSYQSAASRSYLYLHTEVSRALLEFVHGCRLSDRVWFTAGYNVFNNPLPSRDLAQLYQASDVFLLPSSGEGFGMPLLEAQATGLPIIATRNSAITEVVADAGLLINAPIRTLAIDAECMTWSRPPDIDHAAFLMHQMYVDAELRTRCARNGLRRAGGRTWHAVVEELIAELNSVLATSTSTATSSTT